MTKAQRSRLLIFLATVLFITAGTVLMIRYAKGYRPTRQGTIRGTGLLAANSFPTAAEVYINDRLTTATDTTLNLDPGEYDIAIKKDGYFTWSKKLNIQEELVTQTNATLFPTSPTLEPLTFTGALNPIPSPDGNKIAFSVASASASTKNGLYVQELTNTPISLNRSARQIARSSEGYNYATATYTWSPNGSQVLVSFGTTGNVLLEADRFNDLATLTDVTVRLPQIFREWEEELARQERLRLVKFPLFFQNLILSPNTAVATPASSAATRSAQITNIYLSPDGEKLLYQASGDFAIPSDLLPDVPSSSTQRESRDAKTGSWYVYDLKEDKNFLVGTSNAGEKDADKKLSKLLLIENIADPLPIELGTSSPSAFRRLQENATTAESIARFNAEYASIYVSHIQWFPDSYHLIMTSPQGIDIMEYDSTNRTTVYAGPFDSSFVFPWAESSKIITRIQFSPDTIPNLYTIKLK